MNLIETLKAELTQYICQKFDQLNANSEIAILKRSMGDLTHKIDVYATLIEKEQAELKTERTDLFNKIKESQLFLEHELNRIDQEIKK